MVLHDEQDRSCVHWIMEERVCCVHSIEEKGVCCVHSIEEKVVRFCCGHHTHELLSWFLFL